MPEGRTRFVVSALTLRSVHYDFQQCIMLHIALGNNVATGYNISYIFHWESEVSSGRTSDQIKSDFSVDMFVSHVARLNQINLP